MEVIRTKKFLIVLFIIFAILVLVCLGFICIQLYDINDMLSSLYLDFKSISEDVSHTDSMMTVVFEKLPLFNETQYNY